MLVTPARAQHSPQAERRAMVIAMEPSASSSSHKAMPGAQPHRNHRHYSHSHSRQSPHYAVHTHSPPPLMYSVAQSPPQTSRLHQHQHKQHPLHQHQHQHQHQQHAPRDAAAATAGYASSGSSSLATTTTAATAPAAAAAATAHPLATHLRPPATRSSRSGSFGASSSSSAVSRSPSVSRSRSQSRRRSIGSGAQQWRAVAAGSSEAGDSDDAASTGAAMRVEMRQPPRSAVCSDPSRQHFFSPVSAAPPSVRQGRRRHSIHALEYGDELMSAARIVAVPSPSTARRGLHNVQEAETEAEVAAGAAGGASISAGAETTSTLQQMEPSVSLFGAPLQQHYYTQHRGHHHHQPHHHHHHHHHHQPRRGISPSLLLAATSGGSAALKGHSQPRRGSGSGSHMSHAVCATTTTTPAASAAAEPLLAATAPPLAATAAAGPASAQVRPSPTLAEQRAPWFASDMALQRALVKLPTYDGAFVVVAPPGDRQYLVMAVRHANDVWHTNIRCTAGAKGWHFEDDRATFPSLTALLQHYAAVRGKPSVAPPCLLMFSAPAGAVSRRSLSLDEEARASASAESAAAAAAGLPPKAKGRDGAAQDDAAQDDARRRRAYSAGEAIYAHMQPPRASAEDSLYEDMLLTQAQRQRLVALAAALDQQDQSRQRAEAAATEARESRSASLGSFRPDAVARDGNAGAEEAAKEALKLSSAAAMAAVAAADAAFTSAKTRDSGVVRDASVDSSEGEGEGEGEGEAERGAAQAQAQAQAKKDDPLCRNGVASSPSSPTPSSSSQSLRRTQSTGSRASLEEAARRATACSVTLRVTEEAGAEVAVDAAIAAAHETEAPRPTLVDAATRLQSWYRLGLPTPEALSALDNQREGAFIVRSSRAHYASLSYIHGSKLRSVHILSTPQGVHLKQSKEVFPSLGHLVRHLVHHGHASVLCALHPPEGGASQA